MNSDLVNTLADLKEKQALDIVRERLDSGDDPMRILGDARNAMEIVGKRYEEGTYFLPELVYSGEILKIITEMARPKSMKPVASEFVGKFLIGTIAGDIHDIGKNIVTFLLETNGFEVLDLGVDVPAQKFVEAIQEFEPDIVGLSCLLTIGFDSMKETIEAIEKAGLRNRVKIVIGGGVLDDQVVPYVGADAFERFASGAVTLSKKWLGIR